MMPRHADGPKHGTGRKANVLTVGVLAAGLLAAGPFALAAAQDPVDRTGNQENVPAAQNSLRRAISEVEARNGGADVTDSRRFTVGTDAAPAKGESFVIPRQTICPFINFPGVRQEPQ